MTPAAIQDSAAVALTLFSEAPCQPYDTSGLATANTSWSSHSMYSSSLKHYLVGLCPFIQQIRLKDFFGT